MADAPVLEGRGLAKRFGHVEALRHVDFAVHSGEVVALVGDNGAGKTTLVKILSGALEPDDGVILFEGREIRLASPMHARQLGIETVYQDLALADELEPAANLYLGREIARRGILGRLGFLDKQKMRRETENAFARLSVQIDRSARSVGQLSGGQRQGVAVARAVMWASKVVFMDEPTAALGVVQSRKVLELTRRVAERGIGVVFISHNMPDVLEVADRAVVLRLGAQAGEFPRKQASMESLVAAMTGLSALHDRSLERQAETRR